MSKITRLCTVADADDDDENDVPGMLARLATGNIIA